MTFDRISSAPRPKRQATLFFVFCAFVTIGVSGAAFAECRDIPTARFELHGGEAYDKETNLTWMRCSIGQDWVEGQGCVGKVKSLTYERAAQHAVAPWRLPYPKELLSLVSFCKRPIATNEEVFPGIDVPLRDFYWTDPVGDPEFSGVVSFYEGGGNSILRKTHTASVRLVRSGR